jgi:hypothetical protein
VRPLICGVGADPVLVPLEVTVFKQLNPRFIRFIDYARAEHALRCGDGALATEAAP